MGSILLRLIYINVGVFLVLLLMQLVCSLIYSPLASQMLHFIELPSDLRVFIIRPWTLVTYMFAQYDVFHLLFNMLWLYWFGTVFMITGTGRRMAALYLLGGVGGGILFMTAYAVLPVFAGMEGWLIGSSAAVIAIVTATAILNPDYRFHLFLLGEVPLKWIAIVTIIIDMVNVTGYNGGGHVSHIGGALVGVVYALALKRGIDITRPVNRVIDMIANMFVPLFRVNRRKCRPDGGRMPQNKAGKTDEVVLDDILAKIKMSGYTALTQEEKRKLFEISRNIK